MLKNLMPKNLGAKLTAAAALAVLPVQASAHVGGGHADGLVAGLTHPLFGLDHLLAMAAVGIWSAVASAKGAYGSAAAPGRIWAAPLAFVAMMMLGAGMSFGGIELPMVEGMIALSVLVFGLIIVAGRRLPLAAGVALAGAFALFHGHAHASEASGAALAYITGFTVSTAALHVAGIGAGRALRESLWGRVAVGSVLAGAGLAIVMG